ncbi:MAG: biopolymer transport protein ExbB, partial [Pseudohongiellaceae bacterium]
MSKHKMTMALLLLAATGPRLSAQNDTEQQPRDFATAATSVQQELLLSVSELTNLRREITAEKLPLSRELSALENELREVRREFQEASREVDSSSLELANLRKDILAREAETGYLANLLGEYTREFEAQLHIAELPRYEESVERAQLALENTALGEREVYDALIEVLKESLDRLHDALGGTRFEGTAVDELGVVHEGAFVMVGPAALFRSEGGDAVGTAEQRLGSLEPACIPFALPENREAASRFVARTGGSFLLDPSLGNAHKIAATSETMAEHMSKGGPVMFPIIAMGCAA